MKLVLIAGAAAVLAACATPAQAQQQAPPPNCSAAEHHALDFWIGEWDAFRADNNALSGHSSITQEQNGCVIHEHWESVGQGAGYAGQSLNIYNRLNGHWEEYWTDTTGGVLYFVGGPIAHGVQMTTGDRGESARPRYARVTFTDQGDGTVRQQGENSTDGQTWTTGYVLIYRHRQAH
jgi:hypothetical protein